MKIILICATTLDGFIARHSNEKTNWTKDLSLFKSQTMGYPVIMGSTTYETLENELVGRKIIVIHRNDEPKEIINELSISHKQVFIAGGGKTNERFKNYITDMYITPHPIIFGKGIKLFESSSSMISTKLVKKVKVKNTSSLYQYQLKVESIK